MGVCPSRELIVRFIPTTIKPETVIVGKTGTGPLDYTILDNVQLTTEDSRTAAVADLE